MLVRIEEGLVHDMSRIVLALDCTGETYSCGALVEGELLTTVCGLNPRQALRELPLQVAHLLKNAGGSYRDVVAVGVTNGPGSFTGVRLGVTLAKTICFAAECKMAAFDTLEILARGQAAAFQHDPGFVGVALDARRSEVYCALYSSVSEAGIGTQVCSPSKFALQLKSCRKLRALVGQGFLAYPNLVPESFAGPILSSRNQCVVPVDILCQLTDQAFLEDQLLDPESVTPEYHRRADIQVSVKTETPR